MKRVFNYFVLVLCLFLASVADAQVPNWSFSLSNDNQTGLQGSTLVFNGTITNSSGSDLLLTSAGIDFTPNVLQSSYSVDFTDEFLSTGGLIPVTGYSGSVFFVKWDKSVPIGTMEIGTVVLFANSPAQPSSYSQTFTASVFSNTPEPGMLITLVSMGIGSSVLFLYRRRTVR